METEAIRGKIKEIISTVTGIPVASIDDEASYRDDLDLDSLSMLEIGVDVDYAFQLGLAEEAMQEIHTVADAVELVLRHQREQAPRAEVA